MNKAEFQTQVSKNIVATLSRMLWNKEKTIKGFSVAKEGGKHAIRIDFSLPPPFSKNSSMLILVRNNGVVDRWIEIYNDQERKKEEFCFSDGALAAMQTGDAKSVAKQILKEIGE